MCGICGVYNYSDSVGPVQEDLVWRMCNKIAHRGPDDAGVYAKGAVGIGNRRLSIIDLSRGHQPIFNEDATVVIVYNGEVYNYKEIQKDLIKRGHIFTTDCDTEMILHAYEEWGPACLDKFNGMFAFAIWDEGKKQLFLARDRLGIKPLFYSLEGGSFSFGSEIKCILESDKIDKKIDFVAMSHYFSLGYVPTPHTIFKGISKLPPGHYILCNSNGVSIQKYWDVSFQKKRKGQLEDLCEEFIDLLKKSVRLRLISDVPIGAFLSGGIDSSLIVAMMSATSDMAPRTFSIGFDDAVYDESPYSFHVAKQYNTIHQNTVVKADIGEVLGQIVEAFDEPFADDGAIPCFHVCRETRRQVKVALSGLGGDELFGGYHRYLGFQVSQFVSKLPLAQLGIWPKLVSKLPESREGGYFVDRLKRFTDAMAFPPDERYINYLFMMDDARRKNFFSKQYLEEIGQGSVFDEYAPIYNSEKSDFEIDKAYYLDLKTYLSEDVLALTDRMSMWHALEVRVPFLDHNLVEFSASLDPRLKINKLAMKDFLKKSAKPYLDPVILDKRKQGFVGPLPLWLMRDLKDYTLEVLSESNLKRHGFFNYNTVKQILSEHMERKRKHETLIWALLVFEQWHRTYME